MSEKPLDGLVNSKLSAVQTAAEAQHMIPPLSVTISDADGTQILREVIKKLFDAHPSHGVVPKGHPPLTASITDATGKTVKL